MQTANTEQQWGSIQRSLHWVIVVAVATQLVVGFNLWRMTPDHSQFGAIMPIHAGVGLLILFVMLFRLFWRWSHPVPKLPDTLTPLQKSLAHLTHLSLYALLITMPIVGYLLVSASGNPVPFFNAQLPAVLEPSERLAYAFRGLHLLGGITLVSLLALHIPAAMRHAWVLRDGVMERMSPFPTHDSESSSTSPDGASQGTSAPGFERRGTGAGQT